MTQTEEKYPHWKEALFGNDGAVANLRCAVKYVFWHTGYALLGILGVVLLAAAWGIDKVTGRKSVARGRSYLDGKEPLRRASLAPARSSLVLDLV
jgi:hypothetical protein